jgi:DNA-binding PadR family transcriptional regulator
MAWAILKHMGKPVTLLEQLCGHAMSFGARSFETERKDGRQRAFAQIDDARTRIANFEDSSSDARELRANLSATAKKAVRTVIGGKVYILHVRVFESVGEDAFEVSIDPAPKLDPSVRPPFTAKQGQYLAFIYNYTKIHCRAPAESDLERYFRVSPPAIHDMIKTLERNGLIERTPGQARSIRLLVQPEHLPRLK